MSRARASVTKTELRQRLEVLTKAGLGIAAIRADGTIIIGPLERADLPENGKTAHDTPDSALDKWLSNAKS